MNLYKQYNNLLNNFNDKIEIIKDGYDRIDVEQKNALE
jgi:hypothetical protein